MIPRPPDDLRGGALPDGDFGDPGDVAGGRLLMGVAQTRVLGSVDPATGLIYLGDRWGLGLDILEFTG